MSPDEISKLREYCAEFKQYRANTADGSGSTLHDIKVTFDYIAKTLENYDIQGSHYGSELTNKAKAAGEVLSQLWLCLQDLENSVEYFCDTQEQL